MGTFSWSAYDALDAHSETTWIRVSPVAIKDLVVRKCLCPI